MIKDPPLLQIRRHFKRPSPTQVAAFTGLQTVVVVDAMNGRGGLDGRIRSIGTGRPFCGVALPCHTGANDNLAAFGTLLVAQPGDVVMCAADGFERSSVMGDLLLGMMKNAGISAFVTDGFARDRRGIESVGLPCFAAGTIPNSCGRSGPGTVGISTVIGGVAVSAGDIVLGDEDGVVVVPAESIDATIDRLDGVLGAERDLNAKVQAGLKIPDFIQSLADSGKFVELD